MERDDVRQRLATGLRALLQEDSYMIEIGVHERAIVARLGQHLEPLFPSYSVDCEYNRHGIETKRADVPAECASRIDEAGKAIIIPDLIVHRRGHDKNNLLVVEAKKSTDPRGSNCDRLRLAALQRELEYEFAALVEFFVEQVPIPPPTVEWL